MTATNRIISDHVVIKCPACGAYDSAEAAHLADNALIVCRECGETWPAGSPPPGRRLTLGLRRKAAAPLLEAERQPLITYSDPADTAWKAKIEGDYWPDPPRQRRLPMTAAAVASVFFLAAFFGAREAAVAALPDLAGLYAAIGLPVNLERLAIEDVGAERTRALEGPHVTVRATIHNLGATEREIPPLLALLSDGAAPLGAFALHPPAKTIGGGKSISIIVDLGAEPKNAAEVEVRFLRRGEMPPAGGTTRLAAE